MPVHDLSPITPTPTASPTTVAKERWGCTQFDESNEQIEWILQQQLEQIGDTRQLRAREEVDLRADERPLPIVFPQRALKLSCTTGSQLASQPPDDASSASPSYYQGSSSHEGQVCDHLHDVNGGNEEEPEPTYILAPEFSIYIDSPLRAAYMDETESVSTEDEDEDAEEEDSRLEPESPEGRRTLGIILDPNVIEWSEG